jgi:hypothetical protein
MITEMRRANRQMYDLDLKSAPAWASATPLMILNSAQNKAATPFLVASGQKVDSPPFCQVRGGYPSKRLRSELKAVDSRPPDENATRLMSRSPLQEWRRGIIRLPGFEHRYQHGQETIGDTRSARPCLCPL